jgi:hypothetical protein
MRTLTRTPDHSKSMTALERFFAEHEIYRWENSPRIGCSNMKSGHPTAQPEEQGWQHWCGSVRVAVIRPDLQSILSFNQSSSNFSRWHKAPSEKWVDFVQFKIEKCHQIYLENNNYKGENRANLSKYDSIPEKRRLQNNVKGFVILISFRFARFSDDSASPPLTCACDP